MNKLVLFALASFTVAGAANADVYTHGRGGNSYARGLSQDYSYWEGSATRNSAGTKYAYNWDGVSDIIGNSTIVTNYKNALPAASIVRCHSAGCLLTARAIYLFGTGKFSRVVASESAEGGSELANIGGCAADALSCSSLKTSAARSFSHNTSVATHHGGGSRCFAGGVGGLFATVAGAAAWLPGEDDGAVAYHSTLGKASTGTWCDGDSVWYNPASYGCTAWNKGAQYSGHLAREIRYWGHAEAKPFAARGW